MNYLFSPPNQAMLIIAGKANLIVSSGVRAS